MKTLTLSLLCMLLAASTLAQKIEITAGAYGTAFKFSGSYPEQTTFINSGQLNGKQYNYTNNPYGKQLSTGYGVQAQAQLLFHNFILGGQVAYEKLRSSIDISYVSQVQLTPGGPVSVNEPATGTTHLNVNAVNFYPHIGYRLPVPLVKIDITGGLDIGIITGSREKGKAFTTNTQTTYTTNVDRKSLSQDTRLRFGVAATYRHVGLFASYSGGFSNYTELSYASSSMPQNADTPESHSRVFRAGLSYRIF